MSIQGEIDRIQGNVAGAYSAVSDMGGTLPEQQVSGNLAQAIRSIPSGGSPATPLDPMEVYKATRPADWLPMPEPADNEMYLLFHIPDGVSSLLAFTVTCTGSYTVALGTVANGQFVQQSAVSVASGAKYEAELLAADYGNLTSDGFKQAMVKVSGTDILTWAISLHSRETGNLFGWNIMEIACRLPKGTAMKCAVSYSYKSLTSLRYFAWYGTNNVTQANRMFESCKSLMAILQLDTSKVTSMQYTFSECCSLIAIPLLDTSKVTSAFSAFQNCSSLTEIPELDTSNVAIMNSAFQQCSSLRTIPPLDFSKVTSMPDLFNDCRSLRTIPPLDISKVTSMNAAFSNCLNLGKIKFKPDAAGWAGVDISLKNCSLGHQALVDLFNSLPTITSSKALTLTGNPGVSELTDAEKAIAANKNWTLTL